MSSNYSQNSQSNDSSDDSGESMISTPGSTRASTPVNWDRSLTLGNLNDLQSEIADLPMGANGGRLTHTCFCTLRQLRSFDETASLNLECDIDLPSIIRAEIDRSWSHYQLHVALPYEEIAETYPIDNPSTGYDFITEIIRDDCVECFKQVSSTAGAPWDFAYGCNGDGWSYAAIAACANSFGMLKLLCTEGPLGAFIIRLVNPANHNCGEVRPLDIMAKRQDLYFFERLLDEVAPRLGALNLPHLIRDGLSDEGRLDLCRFATPELTAQLHSLDVELYDTRTPESTAWYAGVVNGPGFLDYLYENQPQAFDGPDRYKDSLLLAAAEANYLGSVKWLLRCGADVHYSNTGDPCHTPLHIAAYKSTEESVEILMVLLSSSKLGHPPDYTKMDTNASGLLLTSLIQGLTLTCYHEAIRNDIDSNEYQYLCFTHEARAFRKCGLIWDATDTIGLVWPVDFDLAWHGEAVRLAATAGFYDLANALEMALTHGFDDLSFKGERGSIV